MPAFDETPGGKNPPSIKLLEIGDEAILALVDIDNTKQAHDYDGNPLFWDDGGVRYTKIVSAVVLTAGAAVTGRQGEEVPVAAGDVVSIFVEGSNFYGWRDGLEAFGGQLETGTIFRYRFERTEAPKNPRHNPRQVRSFTFKDSTPETSAQCEALWQERQAPARVLEPAAAPAAAPVAAPLGADEEPF